jgi:hypothetical protein
MLRFRLKSSAKCRFPRAAKSEPAAGTGRISAAGFAPTSKLSRNPNQVARGLIRQFESDIPSQAVQSPPSKCESARNRAVSGHFGMRDPTGTDRLRSAYRSGRDRGGVVRRLLYRAVGIDADPDALSVLYREATLIVEGSERRVNCRDMAAFRT